MVGLLIALIWIVAIVGIFIMKKIQEEDTGYPILAVSVAIMFTIFIFAYTS